MEPFRHGSDPQAMAFHPGLVWDQRRLSQDSQLAPSQTAAAPGRGPRGSSEELLLSIRHREVMAALEELRGGLREAAEHRRRLESRLEEVAAAVGRLERELEPGREETESGAEGRELTVGEYLLRRRVREEARQRDPLFS